MAWQPGWRICAAAGWLSALNMADGYRRINGYRIGEIVQ